jgi:hypothetical protein
MNARFTRFLLQMFSVTLLMGSLIAAAWAVWPVARESGGAAVQRPSSLKTTVDVVGPPALKELQAVWDKRLQGPLYEQPEGAVPLAQGEEVLQMQLPAETAGGGVTLVGTMREEGKSLAIFLHSGGQIDLKQAGESIVLPEGDMRVERIDLGQVTLTNEGGSLTLRLPEAGVQ